MKKAVLTSILILSSLSLKAQQEVLDKNDFFENRPVTNVQSISSNILIVKNVWDPIEQAYVKDTIYSNTPLSTNLNIPSNKNSYRKINTSDFKIFKNLFWNWNHV